MNGNIHPHITIDSITNTLAYLQNYTPNYLPGRYLTVSALRQLACWLQCAGSVRSLRQHPFLAIHFALLMAADLIAHQEKIWFLKPQALTWLNCSYEEQINQLLYPFLSGRLHSTIQGLNLDADLPVDIVAYYQQQIAQQLNHPPLSTTAASWQTIAPNEWCLCLPPNLAPDIKFHLLQFGEWFPDGPLCLTARSIAQAAQQGYGPSQIRHQLEKALQQPLTLEQQEQLLLWYRQADAFTLLSVNLLTTKHPDDLARIMNNGNLRAFVKKQLSSRHAIISAEGIASLTKWTAKQGYILNGLRGTLAPLQEEISPTAYQWFGLNLLVRLARLIPVSYPAPYAEMAYLEKSLCPAELATFTLLSEEIIAKLEEAIQGRDAFFPASHSPSPYLIEQINRAIAQQATLKIDYIPLLSPQPKRHDIEPLRLEQRGSLYYLHAYSLRSETNLVFRLDRIENILCGAQ